jgi:hypothetical protein
MTSWLVCEDTKMALYHAAAIRTVMKRGRY